MKTLLFVALLAFVSFSQTIAQSSFYASKNFERQGVTEYLRMSLGSLSYWNSANKKEIALRSTATSPEQRKFYVSFPGSSAKYKIVIGRRIISCIHPNGKVQVFNALPRRYYSKNFERAGVTEFLEMKGNYDFYLYYTNKNPYNKIRLQTTRDGKKFRFRVKFPGQKASYWLSYQPMCDSDITCTHPDGRKQVFELYRWKD